MNIKKISVVITTYKRELKYVQEAIESVINQTYKPIEILLINDNGEGSNYNDKLEKLCKNYDNVRYILNKENKGAQYSRNKGIMSSIGDYVAFLDDDDIWRKDKLEKQISLFSNPNVGMVFCDGVSFKGENLTQTGVFREASIYDKPISFELELFNDYIGSTSQALILKDCFNKVGLFDCDMPARQDYEMWLRISKSYSIVGSSEKLLYYRIHEGERISTNWRKCFKSYDLILNKYKKDFNKNKYSKAKIILRMFSFYYKINKFVSLKYLLYAFIVKPSCVIDVVIRRIQGKSFSLYYNESKLKKIIKNYKN